MKRVLVTAGAVPPPLDANKLVSNRVRGLWATHFVRYLLERKYAVTLVIPDTLQNPLDHYKNLTVVQHKGFWDYQEKCLALATQHEAAIMAAAVVNWIPAEPYPAKMPTKGFKERDIIRG